MLRKKNDETESAFEARKSALITCKVFPDLREAVLLEVRELLDAGQVLTAMETFFEAGVGWLEADTGKQRYYISEMIKASIAARTAAKTLTDESDKEIKVAMKKAAEEVKAKILADRQAASS